MTFISASATGKIIILNATIIDTHVTFMYLRVCHRNKQQDGLSLHIYIIYMIIYFQYVSPTRNNIDIPIDYLVSIKSI